MMVLHLTMFLFTGDADIGTLGSPRKLPGILCRQFVINSWISKQILKSQPAVHSMTDKLYSGFHTLFSKHRVLLQRILMITILFQVDSMLSLFPPAPS